MMDILSELQTVGLTALFNPTFLFLLILLFFLGKLVGWMTRSINIWKFLALAYFGIFLFRPLQDAGLIIGGVFILGVASMYMDLFRGIFGWSGGIGDVVSAFRFNGAYSDIRRLEREIEELKGQLRASQTAGAELGRAREVNGQRSRFSQNNTGACDPSSRLNTERVSTRSARRKAARLSEQHVECLIDLGLNPERTYEVDDIKAAWRRRAFETHPDRGGSPDEFAKVKRAWKILSEEN